MSPFVPLNTEIGEYRIDAFLGAGGMGEVYRGKHRKIGRIVAIKILTGPSQDSVLVSRFLNEAKIQASLDHPNIASLYGFLEFQGCPCIIMEYVDGLTIAEELAARGHFSADEAIRYLESVTLAVQHVHEQGVLHRDIKSHNIKVNSAGVVKLLDFGIAKGERTPKLTSEGNVIGTIQYLSPEQLRGEAADRRSDVWALGILLYEMLTGTLPFDGESVPGVFRKIESASFLLPSRLNPDVPSALESVVKKCLNRAANRRYQSAQEILEDLQSREQASHLSGHSVKKFTKLNPGWGWVLEHWPISAAAAFLALVLAFGFYFVPTRGSLSSPVEVGSPPVSAGVSGSNNEQSHLRSVVVDVSEGRAHVYQEGELLGTTPVTLKARMGEDLRLVLRRAGYVDNPIEFSVTANTQVYTFSMQRKE